MDTEQFSISRSSRECCEVVTLAGELDMVNASNVSDTLDALSDSARPVVVDLPPMNCASDAVDALATIIDAVGTGRAGLAELLWNPVIMQSRIDGDLHG